MKKISLILILPFLFGPVIAQSETDTINNTSDTTKVVIVQPEFKGGSESLNKYISENFVYPAEAKRRSVDGKVEIEFTVEKTGDLTYIGIVKGIDSTVDEAIVNLFKTMPRWTPATKNGKPVRYKLRMPLNIRASRRGETSVSSEEDLDRTNETLLDLETMGNYFSF
jgi:TonB family protein